MAQTQFFALKDDLLPLFETVESKGPLRYLRADRYLTPKYEIYDQGAKIPNLGRAMYESASSCDAYLVYEPGVSIKARPVDESSGIRTFRIDQLINPDTITFAPGGMWTDEILLYGDVATVSAGFSESAKRLMKRFQSAIRKHLVRIKGYYVGPGAIVLLKAGKRLTIAEQSPRDFDLTLP